MSSGQGISPLLGESRAIEELRDFIVGVSILNVPVLFTGEPGTGKGLAASKVHAVGRTASSSLAKVDCLQMSERELERVLFDGGGAGESLFAGQGAQSCYLAGIEFLTPRIIDRLMRHLQKPEAQGERTPRLIFSSRIEFEDMVDGKLLDLGFLETIAEYHARIPPLHERIEDIPILCNYQLWLNTPPDEYEDRWMEFRELVLPDLLTYPWPGNITELNEVMRTYCGLAVDGTEEDGCARKVLSVDAYYLKEVFRDFYQQFLAHLHLERLTGRHDFVLGAPARRELYPDEHN